MHREEGRIGATIDRLAGSWLNGDDTEIVFVDDGSDDETVAVVEKSLADTGLMATVVRLPENRGKGAAVRAGVLVATGEIVGFVDADLSTDIDDIHAVFSAVEEGRGTVAFASRTHASSTITVRQPRLRQFSGKVFNFALRRIGLTHFNDTQCGLKAFRREIALELFADLRTDGFAFDVEILARSLHAGHRLIEVPVQWRHVEASSVSPTKHGVEMLRDAFRIRRQLRHAGPRRTMTADAFDAMATVERSHWWFTGKRRLALEMLDRFGAGRRLAVDVGSGTGALVEDLARVFDGVIGSELDEHAIKLAAGRGAFVRARAESLPIASSTVTCVTCMDVIEHIDDDIGALVELGRITEPGGLIFVVAPAHRWSWSDHDGRLGHRRRYTRRLLVDVINRAGLEVVHATHFHSWLVVPAFFMRRTPLRFLMRGAAEEASYVSPAVNRALTGVVALERCWLRRFRLPFGLSILAVARVPTT